jgi:ATP phosphoribosyltransferase
MKTRDRLRIAIQKSGRLGEPARDLLARAGFAFRQSDDQLFCRGENLPFDLLLVRDDDIPGLVEEGSCDLGVVGLNLLEERRAAQEGAGVPAGTEALLPLGFGRCRLAIAVPEGFEWSGPASLRGTRIATSYPATLSGWLRAQGVEAEIVQLSGSVEIAPRLGKADAICDLVSTGGTLAANRLREVAPVLESEAVLIARPAPFVDTRAQLADLLLRRLQGALGLRATRLLLCQAPRAALPAILGLLEDAEPPTLMRIEGREDAVSLQALCRKAMTWQRLEDIKRAGASGLLVLPVEQMLA